MVTTTDLMQSIEMRGWRIDQGIITQQRIPRETRSVRKQRARTLRRACNLISYCRCGSEAQNGIVDTAAVEALTGDGTALVLVDMLKERGLLQYSAAGKCYVTGKLVVDTNTCLKAMCYSPHAYVDAGSITNS